MLPNRYLWTEDGGESQSNNIHLTIKGSCWNKQHKCWKAKSKGYFYVLWKKRLKSLSLSSLGSTKSSPEKGKPSTADGLTPMSSVIFNC